jgi:hypothetical protein
LTRERDGSSRVRRCGELLLYSRDLCRGPCAARPLPFGQHAASSSPPPPVGLPRWCRPATGSVPSRHASIQQSTVRLHFELWQRARPQLLVAYRIGFNLPPLLLLRSGLVCEDAREGIREFLAVALRVCHLDDDCRCGAGLSTGRHGVRSQAIAAQRTSGTSDVARGARRQ